MTKDTLNVLRVDASARRTGSASRALGDHLIDTLRADRVLSVVCRDVGSDALPYVTEAWVAANNTAADERNPSQRAELGLSDTLVAELASSDVLLLTLPIYNFGIPASLKAWVDLIARAGLTFRYSSDGPVGLLENKRAAVIVTSGGTAIDSEIDHAVPYLRQALSFVGIDDVDIIAADGQVRDPQAAKGRGLEGVERFAKTLKGRGGD